MCQTLLGPVLGAVLAAAACTAEGSAALAQNFPTKPVSLIVPWPAGGTTDIAMRALAAATEKHLGQSIVIENRPGVSGTLGPTQMAATARPDGHTVAQIPLSLFRVALLTNTMLDPSTDLTYVIGLTGYTFGVVVRSDAPWATFRDLLADAKVRPGKINYGSPGGRTTPHITMVQIARQQGIDWIHVPFKGSSEATNAIVGGHVDATADGTSWGPLVNAGTLRLLVTWGARRTKNWPTVPTLKEFGIDIVTNAPYGLAGPKGMDPKVVKILHDAFKKGMEEPSYAAALTQLDQEPFYLNSHDYHDFAVQQIAEEKRIVEELGLKSD
jgi:tripartite-type tricarboxylate transporter receptor subunit TctC